MNITESLAERERNVNRDLQKALQDLNLAAYRAVRLSSGQATDRAGAPSSQSKAPAQPTNDAREQWIVDQIRKAEGQI